MGQNQVTIYDIAREAGVSIATVSRVFSGGAGVSAKSREKVMQAAGRHYYTPGTVARAIERTQGRTIGVVIPDLTSPYYSRLFCAATEEARKLGYDVWIYQIPRGADYSEESIVDELLAHRCVGAFFTGGIVETFRPELPAAFHRLRQSMPVVAICPPIEGLECVCLYNDLATAIEQIVRHLHMLGHRRIAFVGGSTMVRQSGARGRGFLKAMRELGLEDQEEYDHESGFTPEAGVLGVLKLLAEPDRSRWPTALLCFNDLVALGALKQLRQLGLRVPEDMAVVGCDNSFFAAYTDPPLTTIDLHPEEHARAAIDELLSTGASKTLPFTQMRDATVIIRESCGVKLGARKL